MLKDSSEYLVSYSELLTPNSELRTKAFPIQKTFDIFNSYDILQA